MAGITKTVTWTFRVRVSVDEAFRQLTGALEAMGASVSPIEADNVIEAKTPLAFLKSRREAELRISVTPGQDGRSRATIAITSRGSAAHKSILDELATQSQVKDLIVRRTRLKSTREQLKINRQQAQRDARARKKLPYEALSPAEKAEYDEKKAKQARSAAKLKAKKQKLAEQRAQLVDLELGVVNPAMICPHCGVQGQVRTKTIRAKKGISGGKATGALLTGGISILATGLSRKQTLTKAHCSNCNNDWYF